MIGMDRQYYGTVGRAVGPRCADADVPRPARQKFRHDVFHVARLKETTSAAPGPCLGRDQPTYLYYVDTIVYE